MASQGMDKVGETGMLPKEETPWVFELGLLVGVLIVIWELWRRRFLRKIYYTLANSADEMDICSWFDF